MTTAPKAKPVTAITHDKWLEKYQPVQNPLDKHAAYDGTMFETYGAEVEYVAAHDLGYVWTLLDSGDIVSGKWHIDRLGYFITTVPHGGENIIIEPEA